MIGISLRSLRLCVRQIFLLEPLFFSTDYASLASISSAITRMVTPVMTTATSQLRKFYRSLFTLLLMLLVLTACSTPQRQRCKTQTVPSKDPISSLLKETPHPKSEVPLEKMGYSIQVGAFADEASAARLADGLVAKGYPAELLPEIGRAHV